MKKALLITLSICLLSTQSFANKFSQDNADLSLSIKLLQDDFTKNNDKKNIVVSPFSIYIATAMLANGAANNSLTELLSLLQEENKSTNTADINNTIKNYITKLSNNIKINNSIWGDFAPEYTNIVQTELLSDAKDLPSNTATINQWIAEKTNNKITNLLSEKQTREHDLYLVNTIDFDGQWISAFDTSKTRSKKFYSLSGKTNYVDMMYRKVNANYFEDQQMQSVKLHYKGGDYIKIFLPKENIDFINFVKNLTPQDLIKEYHREDIYLSLPKIEIDYSADLKEKFTNWGITNIFSNETAEFPKMSPIPHYIAEALHQASIKIDESGTKARAATAMHMMEMGESPPPPPPVYFKANRPFVFMINNGLFIGAFVQGTKDKPDNLIDYILNIVE